MSLLGFRPLRRRIIAQFGQEGQVKLKLLEYARVAPLHQKRLLIFTRTSLTSAHQFIFIRRSAESVELAEKRHRSALQLVQRPMRCESQKPTDRRQPQPITSGRRQRGSQHRHGHFEFFYRLSHLQPKGWLQRAMEPPFRGCHRDAIQTGHVEPRRLTAVQNIPTQPLGAELRQPSIGPHIVNHKTSL